ncbi:hypothetical protein VNI00_013146 [Paramarasmius palmivorus]|uniref:carbonic anhydrase n=1 Tax=Paramarasmius palmivorus TaxID=297713 RepID=A0AAW0C090_9AGAR
MHFNALLSILAVTGTATCSCLHGTTFLRRELSEGGQVRVSNFSYDGERGPINWASLNQNNTLCRTGTTQSPINIDDTISKVDSSGAPDVDIPVVNEAAIENVGSSLNIIVNGTTTYQGNTFSLRQFHFHTPGEHRIREEYYPMEMHMVHQSDSGSLLVLAILFQLSEDGCSTDLITSSVVNIEDVREPGNVSKTGRLDFTQIIEAFTTGSLYTYTGSLTTPPCSEGVTFIVLEDPFSIDVKTYNVLKSVMKYNSRYLQNQPNHENLIQMAAEDSGCLASNETTSS